MEPVLETTLAPPAPPPGRAAPTGASERTAALDALRGLSLLGVLAVNLLFLSGPGERIFLAPFDESPDPWALRLTVFLFMGKSYALLAFLVGAGVALQAERIAALGVRPGPLLVRRFLALAAIGLAHGLLLWSGDILFLYGLLALVLLAFLRRRQRTVAAWALALPAANAALFAAFAASLALVARFSPDGTSPLAAEMARETARTVEESLRAYGQGPLGLLLVHRAREVLRQLGNGLAASPQILGLFLAGLWAARAGLLREPAARRRPLGLAAVFLCAAGLAGEILHLRLVSGGAERLPAMVAGQAVHLLSAPALALGAGAAALLVLGTPRGVRLSGLLAPLGRTALTSYLAQSALFTTVFYFYGGGLYGRVGPATCLAIALATWLAQAALARAWLSRFRMGPAEALWRRLTYDGGRP
ncbi:MAG TPA: DUF418 domain-containing protein [Anaeromyxobacteraceae bacterium]|nr:DUF418 domain-containing protein [Anaeromyxobacteraceae bacterium]